MYFNIYVSIFNMAQNYDVILSCPRKELQNSFNFFSFPVPLTIMPTSSRICFMLLLFSFCCHHQQLLCIYSC